MAVLKKPDARDCFTGAVKALIADNLANPPPGQATLPSGVTIGNVTVGNLSFPTIGEDSVAYRVTVGIDAGRQHVDGIIDIVSFIKGRAGVTMEYEGLGSPFPEDLAKNLAGAVAGRLPAS